MSSSMIVIVVIVVAVIVVLALVDRIVSRSSSRREAERELANRERHQKLDIRPLPAEAREQYRRRLSAIQDEFVDHPGEAIAEADQMLTQVMADRGYPTDAGYEQQENDLSVEHSRTLEHYRTARETLQGHEQSRANTEELRRAIVHYRTVFDELLNNRAPATARNRSDEGDLR